MLSFNLFAPKRDSLLDAADEVADIGEAFCHFYKTFSEMTPEARAHMPAELAVDAAQYVKIVGEANLPRSMAMPVSKAITGLGLAVHDISLIFEDPDRQNSLFNRALVTACGLPFVPIIFASGIYDGVTGRRNLEDTYRF